MYEELASLFYDFTKPIDGDYPDVPYYLDLLGSQDRKILEIGAGTGRLCIPLLLEGYKVDALECSPHMISLLLQNLGLKKSKTKIHEMRAEDMKFQQSYDDIIVSFGSFQLFSDLGVAQKCLQLFRKALKKGGRLFVDLDVIRPEVHKAGLKSYGTEVQTSKTEKILLEGSRSWDFIWQTENVHLRYELWQKGKLKSTELQNFSLRWYGIWEFHALLKAIGFSSVEIYSDYTPDAPDSDTQTLSYVAKL